jgi:glutamyl-tRNA synthetase
MKLLATGHAYPDYMTKDDLDAARKAAEAAKQSYVHRGPHRETPADECARLYKDKPTTLRLKVPAGKTLGINDLIRGAVEWQSDLIGDPVILRADGRALYNFATVVDDAAMQITHIVRAAEHLTNTAVQVVAYEALGHPLPQFAHVPVVNEPKSKKKLSKRDMKKFVTEEVRSKLRAVGWTDAEMDTRDDLNPATIAFYRELGYLPAGLVNYLGRLGWSLDDKAEIILLDQMTANFSLDRVNNAPASFDPEKLDWVVGEYMKALPLDQRVEGVLPFLRRAKLIGEPVDEPTRLKIRRIVDVCKDRLKIFSDILLYATPFLLAEPVYDPKAVEKRLKKPGAAEILSGFAPRLKAIEPFEPAPLEEALKSFCAERAIKFGDAVHPIRVATTGTEVGVGLFETLSILGRDEVLRRIELAQAR